MKIEEQKSILPPKSGLPIQHLIKLMHNLPKLKLGDAKQFSEDLTTIRNSAKIFENN